MKKIGILFVTLLLSGLMAMAQSSSSASGSTSGTDNDVTKQQHKDAATSDEMAAQAAKDKAKNAGSDATAEHEKAVARLDEGGKVLNQLLTTPDNGIPRASDGQCQVRCGHSFHD